MWLAGYRVSFSLLVYFLALWSVCDWVKDTLFGRRVDLRLAMQKQPLIPFKSLYHYTPLSSRLIPQTQPYLTYKH